MQVNSVKENTRLCEKECSRHQRNSSARERDTNADSTYPTNFLSTTVRPKPALFKILKPKYCSWRFIFVVFTARIVKKIKLMLIS